MAPSNPKALSTLPPHATPLLVAYPRRYGSASEDESDDESGGGTGLFGLVAYVDEDAEERRRSREGEAATQRLDEEDSPRQSSQDSAPNGMASVASGNGDSHAASGSIGAADSSGAGVADAEGGRDTADDNLLPPRPSGEIEVGSPGTQLLLSTGGSRVPTSSFSWSLSVGV